MTDSTKTVETFEYQAEINQIMSLIINRFLALTLGLPHRLLHCLCLLCFHCLLCFQRNQRNHSLLLCLCHFCLCLFHRHRPPFTRKLIREAYTNRLNSIHAAAMAITKYVVTNALLQERTSCIAKSSFFHLWGHR